MEKKFMNKMDDMELDMVVGGARVYLVTKIRNHLGIVDYHVAQGNYDGDMKDLDKLAEIGKIDEKLLAEICSPMIPEDVYAEICNREL
jgi:hypothetical protein